MTWAEATRAGRDRGYAGGVLRWTGAGVGEAAVMAKGQAPAMTEGRRRYGGNGCG
jgi:hypothetical protein